MGDYHGVQSLTAFLHFCYAKFKRRQEERIYKIYVTDTLKAICGNFIPDKNYSVLNKRYADIAYTRKQNNAEETLEAIEERIDKVFDSIRRGGSSDII